MRRYAPIPDAGVPHGDAGWLEAGLGLAVVAAAVAAAARLGVGGAEAAAAAAGLPAAVLGALQQAWVGLREQSGVCASLWRWRGGAAAQSRELLACAWTRIPSDCGC